METVVGGEVTLLERLHRKRLANSTLVTKEVTIPISLSRSMSNMDSAANPSGHDTAVSAIPSLFQENYEDEA